MGFDTDPVTVLHVSAMSISMARAVALYIMNEEYCMVFPCITEREGDMTYMCPDFLRGEPIDYRQERLDYLRGRI